MALIPRARTDWEPFRPSGTERRRWWWSSRLRSRRPRLHRATAPLDELLDELAERWEHGETPPAEEFIGRLSSDDREGIVALAYKEYCLAEEAGFEPEPHDLLDRFPEHADRLGRLLELHAAIDLEHLRVWVDDSMRGSGVVDVGPGLPRAGDTIGPYVLRRELGRGSFARVFLAAQADLEDRYVVVKVSTRASPEPGLLARARHAQIVEVLGRTEAEDGALHLLCMPFLGGATLGSVLAERRRWGGPPRRGSELLTDLDQVAAPEYPVSGRAGPSREVLERLSYPKAVAWLIARLAEALDHAYTRDVTHGDLKPSNILLAADGRPLLIDFNLSVDWRRFDGPDDLPASELGGTLAYMAPERLRALAAPERAPAPRSCERHTADIYALGLILAEALTGRVPPVPGDSRLAPRAQAAALAEDRRGRSAALRSFLTGVPAELLPILHRCLDPDPARRYARATELAEDLEHFRADCPPRHAGPIARRHRALRWARRHRIAVAAGVILLAGAVPAAVLAGVRSRHEAAEAKLDQIWNGGTPSVYRARRDGQRIPITDVDAARAALDALSLYGLTDPGDWRGRWDVTALPEATRLDLEAWLMEQAWRYAEAVATRPTNDWTAAGHRALEILERAGGSSPPTPLLAQQSRLRDLLALGAADFSTHAAPAWLEQYLLGVEDEATRPAEALKHYRAAVLLRTDAYWSHYRLATAACAPDVREFALAERHLRRCLEVRPTNPLLHLFQAGLLYHVGQPGAAVDKANRALELAPELLEAYRTRLWARLKVNEDEAVRLARKPNDADPVSADFRRVRGGFEVQQPRHSWQILRDANAAFGPEVALAGDSRGHLGAASFFDPDARLWNAQQLYLEGHREAALEETDRLVRMNAGNLEARYQQLAIQFELDNSSAQTLEQLEALVNDPGFEPLLARFPDAMRAHLMIADRATELKEFDLALASARRAVELSEQINQYRDAARRALERVLAAHSDFPAIDREGER